MKHKSSVIDESIVIIDELIHDYDKIIIKFDNQPDNIY